VVDVLQEFGVVWIPPNLVGQRPNQGQFGLKCRLQSAVGTADGEDPCGDQGEDNCSNDAFDGECAHDDDVTQVASSPHVGCRGGGPTGSGLAHDEGFAAQATPCFTGRGIDPQPGLQLGFIRRKSGVAAKSTGV
jgi:hypothetical protein